MARVVLPAGGPREPALGLPIFAAAEGSISLYRGSGDGLAQILLIAEKETSPERLEHEYALKSEPDAGWAARPVALRRS